MEPQIHILLLASMRGTADVKIFCPKNLSLRCRINKCLNLWHFATGREAGKVEAWLTAANKLHLTASEMRRLRKNKVLSFSAPSETAMKNEWKRIHTRNAAMWQHPNTPNLSNV